MIVIVINNQQHAMCQLLKVFIPLPVAGGKFQSLNVRNYCAKNKEAYLRRHYCKRHVWFICVVFITYIDLLIESAM